MGRVAVGVAVVCAATAVAVAAVVVRRRMRSSGKWARAEAVVRELEEKCATPIGKLRQVADAMTVEMHAGLASEGGSKLKMLISYVDNLPTGYPPAFLRFKDSAFSNLNSDLSSLSFYCMISMFAGKFVRFTLSLILF